MKLKTTKETAELLRIKPNAVRRYRRLGALPAARIGKTYLFSEDDIKRFVTARSGR